MLSSPKGPVWSRRPRDSSSTPGAAGRGGGGGLDGALFAPGPRVFCDIAESGGEPVGFALWFYSFSTFAGRHGIYLEDLFVEPAHRGRGIVKAMLEALARRCVAEGLAR